MAREVFWILDNRSYVGSGGQIFVTLWTAILVIECSYLI